MDTCTGRKRKCRHAAIWKSQNIQWVWHSEKFEPIETVYAEVEAAAIFFRLYLLQHAFCFRFRKLPPSSKCRYTLTIWLGVLGHSRSQIPDCAPVSSPKNITNQFVPRCVFFCVSLCCGQLFRVKNNHCQPLESMAAKFYLQVMHYWL